jgi:hypothetical protein
LVLAYTVRSKIILRLPSGLLEVIVARLRRSPEVNLFFLVIYATSILGAKVYS